MQSGSIYVCLHETKRHCTFDHSNTWECICIFINNPVLYVTALQPKLNTVLTFQPSSGVAINPHWLQRMHQFLSIICDSFTHNLVHAQISFVRCINKQSLVPHYFSLSVHESVLQWIRTGLNDGPVWSSLVQFRSDWICSSQTVLMALDEPHALDYLHLAAKSGLKSILMPSVIKRDHQNKTMGQSVQ